VRTGSAADLGAFGDGHFHVVIAKHVVEHLPDPDLAVREFSRVLASGGLALISTPNLDSAMRSRKGGQWIGYRDKTHISLRSPAEWTETVRAAGLRVRRVFSDGFWDPPYVPLVPVRIQKLLFGAPGGAQAVLGVPFLPVRWGESIILVANKG
jgi:SAM-dependent methyltransferase